MEHKSDKKSEVGHYDNPAEREAAINALFEAARAGDVDKIDQLLKDPRIDSIIDARDSQGRNALLHAAINGHVGVVQLLANKKEATIYARDSEWQNALHLAAINGHRDVMEWLVNEKKADITSTCPNNEWTALHYAAANGHLNVVEWLVNEKKADIHAHNTQGWHPLYHAAANGHRDVVKYLVSQEKAGITTGYQKHIQVQIALLHAAINGQLDMVRWLLTESGTDITKKLEKLEDKNLLQVAAIHRQFGVVKLLVGEFGMSPDSITRLPPGATFQNWRSALKLLFDMHYLKQQQSISEHIKPNISVAVQTFSPLIKDLVNIITDYWNTSTEGEFSYTELEQHQQLFKQCLDWADTPSAWQRSAQKLLDQLITDPPATVGEVDNILKTFLESEASELETKATAPTETKAFKGEITETPLYELVTKFSNIIEKHKETFAGKDVETWSFFQPPSLPAAQLKNNHELFQALQKYAQSSKSSDIDLAITLVEKILFQHSYSLHTINGIIEDSCEAYQSRISSELSGLIHRLLSATNPKKINSSLINRPFLARDKQILWQNEYLLRDLKALSKSSNPLKRQSRKLAKQLLDKISSQCSYNLLTIQQAIRDDLTANSKNPDLRFTKSCRNTLTNMERLKLLPPVVSEKKEAPADPPPPQATSYTTKGPTDNKSLTAEDFDVTDAGPLYGQASEAKGAIVETKSSSAQPPSPISSSDLIDALKKHLKDTPFASIVLLPDGKGGTLSSFNTVEDAAKYFASIRAGFLATIEYLAEHYSQRVSVRVSAEKIKSEKKADAQLSFPGRFLSSSNTSSPADTRSPTVGTPAPRIGSTPQKPQSAQTQADNTDEHQPKPPGAPTS